MSVNEVKTQPAPFQLEVRGTGHPSSRTYAIGDEDHTLGNALRHILMNNKKCEFAGYSVPHPSEPVVHIRVQTAKNSNVNGVDGGDGDEDCGKLPATEVLKEACETLIAQCDVVLDKIEEIMPEVRKDRMELEDFIRNEGYGEGGDDQEDDDEMIMEGEGEEASDEDDD